MALDSLTRAQWDFLRRFFEWLRSLFAGGGGTIEDYKCCSLARPDNECIYYFGDKANYACPEGYYRQWWYCFEGTQRYGCGECTQSAQTCWTGPFECSIFWEAA
jgi:hypothetical protein